MSNATQQMLLVTMVPLKHWPKQTQHIAAALRESAQLCFYDSPFYKPAAGEVKDQISQNCRVCDQQHGNTAAPPENRQNFISFWAVCL